MSGRPFSSPDRMLGKFRRPLPEPTIDVPDSVLVGNMCAHGHPREEAFTQFKRSMPRQYHMLRGLALKFWLDCVYADRGDADAKERVEYCEHIWRTMRDRKGSAIIMPHTQEIQ